MGCHLSLKNCVSHPSGSSKPQNTTPVSCYPCKMSTLKPACHPPANTSSINPTNFQPSRTSVVWIKNHKKTLSPFTLTLFLNESESCQDWKISVVTLIIVILITFMFPLNTFPSWFGHHLVITDADTRADDTFMWDTFIKLKNPTNPTSTPYSMNNGNEWVSEWIN